MDTAKPQSLVFWRRLFLGLETAVLGIVVWAALGEILLPRQRWDFSGPYEIVLVVLYGLAWLFLLVVSPFFFRSLRWVAWLGWIIAVSIFVLGMVIPIS